MSAELNESRAEAMAAMIEKDEVAHWLEDAAMRVRRGEIDSLKFEWVRGQNVIRATETPTKPMVYTATMIKLEIG